MKVSSCRASFKIIASPKGIELDSEVPENVRWVDMCRVLDWVEESMMSVRKEVGADL